jgi:hypothetical protein
MCRLILVCTILLGINSVGHTAPDINLQRYATTTEVAGEWSLVPKTLELARRSGHSPEHGTPHDVWLKPWGDCLFNSIVESDGKVEYVESRGTWKLSHDNDSFKPSVSKNEIRIQLPDRGEIRFYLTEDQGELRLWNYWGDQARWEFVQYENIGSRPISFRTDREQRITFQAGVEPAIFYIVVTCVPTPKAVIRIEPFAGGSPRKPWNDLVWKKPMEKLLTGADIKLMEDRFLRIRSQSTLCDVVPPYRESAVRRSSLPFYEFSVDRLILEKPHDGDLHRKPSLKWESIREETYYVSDIDTQAELAFLKAFVGYAP